MKTTIDIADPLLDEVVKLLRRTVGRCAPWWGQIAGPRIHDARIAAICLANGVTELLSVDRDFSRFPALGVRNPLVRSANTTD